MKVIFLDVDGVLNNSETKDTIDLNKVKLLSSIVKQTDAKIVLSSSWKILNDPKSPAYKDYIYLIECLASEGLTLIDQTPGPCHNRPKEIHQWLEQHPQVSSWVSLDDDFGPYEYTTNGLDSRRLVQTHYWESLGGLQEAHVPYAIAILNDNLNYLKDLFDKLYSSIPMDVII